jgi:S1-C subfamily serine protease
MSSSPSGEIGSVPSVARLPHWRPINLALFPILVSAHKSGAELFKFASRSIWVVSAVSSFRELRVSGNISIGSAVAVTQSELLTNCHVVKGHPVITIKKGQAIHQVRVVAGDDRTDRCILSTKGRFLTPVAGMRRFDDLKVGEEVYTIGTPAGFERTLGNGIISGLRTVEGQNLVQTTAQMSSGSSGGGLFDKSGNLIGITTFILRDSQGLNFAIAAEDFFR